MAAFVKFNVFVQDVGNKVHNLGSDTLKICLTNSAPVATNALLSDITDLSTANGYTAGGTTVASTAYSQSSGTAKLTGNAVTFTASGGSVGPFRYAVLYNSTPTSPLKPLIGSWDYGSSVTLADGESFKAAADSSGANWSSSLPILSLA
jgi:hypothetical protein